MIIDMQRIFGEPISEWATLGYAWATAGIQRRWARSSPVMLHSVSAAGAADRHLGRLLRAMAFCARPRERPAV